MAQRCFGAKASGSSPAVWAEITSQERALDLPATREPDLGFAAAVAAWARGDSLTDALTVAIAGGTEMTAGDFVRWCRQVVDLLDQLAAADHGAGPGPGVGVGVGSGVGSGIETVTGTAALAVTALRRGVVAMGSV